MILALISKINVVKVKDKNNSNSNIESKLINPKQKEQREIMNLTDELLHKEASASLIYLMNNGIDVFNSKLNDECVYYFGGEYLSQDNFIRKLKN
jgi:hypothetical protein